MTEQENKAKFKQAIDHTLSGLQGDPFLYQRVAAHAEKGERNVKHHFPRVLVIVLIVLSCMGTVAAAGGMLGGTVNWLGEVVPGEQLGFTYPDWTAEEEEMHERLSELVHMLDQDGEMVAVTTSADGKDVLYTHTSLKYTVDNMETFAALMAGGENVPVPNFIPEGYELIDGGIAYTCRAGGQWHLVERLTPDENATAERYRLDEEDMIFSRYTLFFRDSSAYEQYLYIIVTMMPLRDVSRQSIVYGEDQTLRVITVPGMDQALVLTSEHDIQVNMRRQLEEPIGFVDFDDGEGSFGEIEVDVYAASLDADTLIRMFATE